MTLTLTSANVSADQQQGSVIRNVQAGAILTVGQTVYIDGSDTAQLADANGASEAVARAVGVVVAAPNMYGETSIASGDRCSVCVFGPVYGFTGMTPGARVYVGTTPGELTQTPPTPNAYQFTIGIAISASVLFINPEADAAASV